MKTLYPFNLFLVLIALFFCAHASSDELVYTRDTSIDYFNSSSDIYTVMKVGGRISYSEYKEYLIDELGEDELYETWKNIKLDDKEKFLILKKHKGGEKIGAIISAVQLSDYGVTKIGKKYLLFFHKNSKAADFEFGACDVIELDSIPNLVTEDLKKMITYIGKSTLTPCLYQVEYDQK